MKTLVTASADRALRVRHVLLVPVLMVAMVPCHVVSGRVVRVPAAQFNHDTGNVLKDVQLPGPEFSAPPTWPEQTYYDEDGPAFTLDCLLVPGRNATEVWFKDGNQLPLEQGDSVTNGNQSLTFRDPQRSDTGMYRCMAWNLAGNISYERQILITGRIDVVAPTVIATSPSSQLLQTRLGEQVNISCVFDVGGSTTSLLGFTPSWKRNGSIMNDTNHTTWDEDVRAEDNDLIFNLLIDSVQEPDFGDYECWGSNSLGNTSRVLTLLSQEIHPDTASGIPFWMYIVIGASALVLLVVSVVTVTACRRYHHNQYKNLEWKEPDVSQYDVVEGPVLYDAFISYSSEDQAWVKDSMFANLRQQGYQVCVDFKDFTPGMAVSENIMDAIYKSRKTIVVMSNNFLKSMWGQFELQQAHNRAITQRKDVLILVKIDGCKVPVKLMGTTFLDWSNPDVRPHFWQRLYEAIGEPTCHSVATQDSPSPSQSLATQDSPSASQSEATKESQLASQSEAIQESQLASQSDAMLESFSACQSVATKQSQSASQSDATKESQSASQSDAIQKSPSPSQSVATQESPLTEIGQDTFILASVNQVTDFQSCRTPAGYC